MNAISVGTAVVNFSPFCIQNVALRKYHDDIVLYHSIPLPSYTLQPLTFGSHAKRNTNFDDDLKADNVELDSF